MMKHLFKRVAALLLSAILVASLITAASADDVIFSIYDADGELIKTLNTINIVLDAEVGKYVDEDSPITIVQEKDIVLPSTITNQDDLLGVWIGPNMTLDMNGHSITLNENNVGAGFAVTVGVKNQYGKQIVIKNGSIIINAKSEAAEALFYLGVSSQYYLLLENVSISGGNYGVVVSGDAPIQSIPKTIVTVTNCIIKDTDIPLTLNPLPSQPSIEGTAIVVESGNIENLYSGNAYSGRNVAVNSTSKTIEVDGVTGTVIVSPDTTSIIVDDGNTYLYDTLQDAVDAVDAHGTIYLLKQPSDGKVTVPEKAGFRIVPFDEDSEVDTGKLQLVTASGNKASVDEDGYIVIEQPWIVTLDNGNGAAETYEVIKGQPFTFPAAPSNSGYIFLGWRGADGRTDNTGDVVEISGDTTFKAVWGNLSDVTEPSEPNEPVVPVFPFNDVTARDWYYSAVKYVYEKGLMDGVDVGVFEPNANMTRAMVWAILARIDGETVTGANWIDTARAWAMAEGVSDGTDPNGLVTREQFATMLWRYAGEPASSYSLAKFTDNASVSDWASTAMSWAVEKGIITGVTGSTFVPKGTATRAQCAAMLMRFAEL